MTTSKKQNRWIIFGSELSPFTLKVIALCEFSGLPHRFLPTRGKWSENLRIVIRKGLVTKKILPLTWPEMTDLDEFPLVPFLFGPNGENLYDSSSIGVWLDRLAPIENRNSPVFPEDDPAMSFVIRLIDEYADEYGLYLVHHFRWKVSAADNNAGKRLAHEFRTLAGIAQPLMARRFSARQVRRLPYLFSVAPKGFRIENLPQNLQPPSHKDFPSTHELLETSYTRLLSALELILQDRPFLLGDQFTLADASIYGQLAMNLTDPSAAQKIQQESPLVFKWLNSIQLSDFTLSRPGGQLLLDNTLKPLLAEICRTYVPLMHQNLAAYQNCQAGSERLFNERAFWKNQAIYSGKLDNTPFSAVVKTFQVKTWKDIRAHWSRLDQEALDRVKAVLPDDHGLDRDT